MVLSGDLVLERLDGVVVRVDAKRSRSWNSASASMRSRQIRKVPSSALSYVKYECKGPDRMSTSYPQGFVTHKLACFSFNICCNISWCLQAASVSEPMPAAPGVPKRSPIQVQFYPKAG